MDINRSRTDSVTVQMVAGFLGLSSLLIISGLILLASMGRIVPEPLATLGGAAIGALGSLLARTATEERRVEPVAVEVKNSPSQPVPVEGGHDQSQNQSQSQSEEVQD